MMSTDPRPYPVVNPWARGCYLARIIGPHPEYVYDREFLRGTPIKTRRVLEYRPGRDLDTEPRGWYVARAGHGAATRLLELTPVGWTDHGGDFTPPEILAVHEAGAPGAPGAWTGERCQCGRPEVAAACLDDCRALDETGELVGALPEPF